MEKSVASKATPLRNLDSRSYNIIDLCYGKIIVEVASEMSRTISQYINHQGRESRRPHQE